MLCDYAANFRQFYLLLWKNFILQVRRPIGSLFELIIPIIALLLIIVLRHTVFDIEDKCFVTFEPDPLQLPDVTTVLFYAPNNTEENEIMGNVSLRLQWVKLMPAPSENQMIDDLRAWRKNSAIITGREDSCINGYGIVFNDIQSNDIQYTIRPPHEVDGFFDQETWDTDDAQPRFQQPGPRFFPNLYLSEGFLHIQNLVSMSIIKRIYEDRTSKIFQEIPVNTKQFPYPPYERNEFLLAIQNIMPLLIILSLIYSSGIFVRIDVNKMPLGKLSKKQIESAYKVLTEALTEIQGDKNSTKLLDASNRFYTLIPHDFGFQTPPLLDDEEFIKAKTQMLDNLLEIEVAYNMLRDEANEGKTKNPIDANYEKLNTDIEVLIKDSEEFKMLEEYVANTHAPTHSSYSLELMDVFKIERHGEGKRYKPFKKLPNRKLLWHGSRTTNYAGILSQGLRIAPPEAPVTGYMFGKGVYFADMASKSANYCFTSRSKNVGLVLLCEVALGNMVEKTHAENVTKLPQGKHSVKGLGSTQPDPAGTRMLDGGVEVPMGTHSASGVDGTSLLYNEYIVYDVAQINMKYLLKLKFHYK